MNPFFSLGAMPWPVFSAIKYNVSLLEYYFEKVVWTHTVSAIKYNASVLEYYSEKVVLTHTGCIKSLSLANFSTNGRSGFSIFLAFTYSVKQPLCTHSSTEPWSHSNNSPESLYSMTREFEARSCFGWLQIHIKQKNARISKTLLTFFYYKHSNTSNKLQIATTQKLV